MSTKPEKSNVFEERASSISSTKVNNGLGYHKQSIVTYRKSPKLTISDTKLALNMKSPSKEIT
jgi:hypothetical protein